MPPGWLHMYVCVARPGSQWSCQGWQWDKAYRDKPLIFSCSFTTLLYVEIVGLERCRQASLFLVALFASLHFPVDSNLLRSLKKPPTAKSHPTIDGASDHPKLCHVSHPFYCKPHWFPSVLMGESVCVKSGGTGVPCEACEVPSVLWLTKKSCRVASPLSHSSSPLFFPPTSICPHIVVNKWMQSVALMCVYVWPVPISDLLFGIVNSAQRLSLLIYSLARLGLCVSPCVRVQAVWLDLLPGSFHFDDPPFCFIESARLLSMQTCAHAPVHTTRSIK